MQNFGRNRLDWGDIMIEVGQLIQQVWTRMIRKTSTLSSSYDPKCPSSVPPSLIRHDVIALLVFMAFTCGAISFSINATS
jgi:hypothetical protein